MSEYVQVKPRRTFVHTMKEVKLESTSNDQQSCSPTKRSKIVEKHYIFGVIKLISFFFLCVYAGKFSEPEEIDDAEHHLDDEEDFPPTMTDADLIAEQCIEVLPDDSTDPLENNKPLIMITTSCDDVEFIEPPVANLATKSVLMPANSSTPLPKTHAKKSSYSSVDEHNASSPPIPQKKSDEFDIFGNFVGQVMKNMPKAKARLLQMKFLQLITEYDE